MTDSAPIETRILDLEKRLNKMTDFMKSEYRPEVDHTGLFAAAIDPLDPIIGPATAKVTIVESFEFMCPFSHLASEVVQKVLDEYPNDVRFVAKYLVVHGPQAIPPALAFYAASKQGKAPLMHRMLWKELWPEKDPEGQVNLQALLLRLAKNAELDMDQFKLDWRTGNQWIAKSSEFAQTHHIDEVPTFFINGRFTARLEYDGFKALVEEELTKASALIDGGVKPEEIYEKMVMAKGLPEPKAVWPFEV
jgi:predicted DsbA family dithiol-disulfide isomerase